jgi:hypothetical protein
LLVRPSGARNWLEFRDVFEVDRTSVRDRGERLVKLFVEPADSTEIQVAKIIDESARYNIGSVQRTVNIPVLPLLFLEPKNQARFRFKRSSDRAPGTARDVAAAGVFRVTTEIWTIEYSEQRPETMIRTTGMRDFPSRGRFWIDPATGRVLMSELVLENRLVRAVMDVSYQSEPLMGLLVPVEMRERIEGRRDGSLLEGTATYGRFRQFQVSVDEKFAPIKK